jgi:hypothetical protein
MLRDKTWGAKRNVKLSNYPYVSSVTGIEEDNWERTRERVGRCFCSYTGLAHSGPFTRTDGFALTMSRSGPSGCTTGLAHSGPFTRTDGFALTMSRRGPSGYTWCFNWNSIRTFRSNKCTCDQCVVGGRRLWWMPTWNRIKLVKSKTT